jgi:two-component system chemotaxis sensor kinase CheA
LQGGDREARVEAGRLLRQAAARLSAGLPAVRTRWPAPPEGLTPSRVPKALRNEYRAVMRGRLGEIDAALVFHGEARAALNRAFRAVHAMKSSASGAGDDAFAWYCHGLEARLKLALNSEADAAEAMIQMARHRALCALWLEDPARALETLRALAERRRPSERPPSSNDEAADEGPVLHVPASLLTRLLVRLERLEATHEEFSAAAELAHQGAKRVRRVRGVLLGALGELSHPRLGTSDAGIADGVERPVRHPRAPACAQSRRRHFQSADRIS